MSGKDQKTMSLRMFLAATHPLDIASKLRFCTKFERGCRLETMRLRKKIACRTPAQHDQKVKILLKN